MASNATLHLGDSRKARRGWSLTAVLAVGGVVLAVVYFAGAAYLHRRAEIAETTAEARPWGIVGPACPSLSAAAYEQSLAGGGAVTEFNGAVIGRHHGNAFCSEVSNHDWLGLSVHSVCQFSDPWVLKVQTDVGTWFFNPQAGHKATLSMEGGAPRCVMAAPYWAHVQNSIF